MTKESLTPIDELLASSEAEHAADVSVQEQIASKPEGNSESETEATLSIGGLVQAINRFRLKGIENRLRVQAAGDGDPSNVSEAKRAKIGKRGAVNAGIGNTYGDSRQGIGGTIVDSSSVPHSHSRKTHLRNARRIAKANPGAPGGEPYVAHLEAKRATLLDKLYPSLARTELPEKPTRKPASPLPPISENFTQYAAYLKDSAEVGSATEKSYKTLLNEAMTHETLDGHSMETVFGQITSSNSPLVRHTAERAVRDGVVDEDGRVLKSPDEIGDVLAFDKRPSPTDKGSERPSTNTELAELATKLFELAEQSVYQLVLEDTSRRTIRRKYEVARQITWDELAYMVDESNRPELITLFSDLLEDSGYDNLDDTEDPEFDARALYDEAEGLIELAVNEDTSNTRKGDKYLHAREKVWAEIADIFTEDEAKGLMQQFQQFQREAQRKHATGGDDSSRKRSTDKSSRSDGREVRIDEDDAYKATIALLAHGLVDSGGQSYTRLSSKALEVALLDKGSDAATARKIHKELREKGYLAAEWDEEKGFEVLRTKEEFQQILTQLEG